jgi:hypothetical protein
MIRSMQITIFSRNSSSKARDAPLLLFMFPIILSYSEKNGNNKINEMNNQGGSESLRDSRPNQC